MRERKFPPSCSAPYCELTAKAAAETLAKLIGRKLGAEVSPASLQKFVRDNFTRVSVLAHKMHQDGVGQD